MKTDCKPFWRSSWLLDKAYIQIVHLTKPASKLEWEFDESNPYIKFGKNLIKNAQVRVTTAADTDRLWPFWLSLVRQNPYSNLNKFDGSNPYLKYGRNPIKMTELKWPQWRTDRQAKNNRAPPRMLGVLITLEQPLSLPHWDDCQTRNDTKKLHPHSGAKFYTKLPHKTVPTTNNEPKMTPSLSLSRTPDRDFRCFYPSEKFLSHFSVPACGKNKKQTAACWPNVYVWRHCNVKMTSPYRISAYLGFSGSLFHIFHKKWGIK